MSDLRDQIADTLAGAGDSDDTFNPWTLADALMPLIEADRQAAIDAAVQAERERVAGLLAERDEALAAVERVRALADEWADMSAAGPVSRGHAGLIRAALDGDPATTHGSEIRAGSPIGEAAAVEAGTDRSRCPKCGGVAGTHGLVLDWSAHREAWAAHRRRGAGL